MNIVEKQRFQLMTHNQLLSIKKLLEWRAENGLEVDKDFKTYVNNLVVESNTTYCVTLRYPQTMFNRSRDLFNHMPNTEEQQDSFHKYAGLI